jgi:hypothetical protein
MTACLDVSEGPSRRLGCPRSVTVDSDCHPSHGCDCRADWTRSPPPVIIVMIGRDSTESHHHCRGDCRCAQAVPTRNSITGSAAGPGSDSEQCNLNLTFGLQNQIETSRQALGHVQAARPCLVCFFSGVDHVSMLQGRIIESWPRRRPDSRADSLAQALRRPDHWHPGPEAGALARALGARGRGWAGPCYCGTGPWLMVGSGRGLPGGSRRRRRSGP